MYFLVYIFTWDFAAISMIYIMIKSIYILSL